MFFFYRGFYLFLNFFREFTLGRRVVGVGVGLEEIIYNWNRFSFDSLMIFLVRFVIFVVCSRIKGSYVLCLGCRGKFIWIKGWGFVFIYVF